MTTPGNFVPPEPGGFVPPEEGGFVPEFLQGAPAPAAGPEGGEPAATPAASVGTTRRKVSRRNSDQLGIVWVRGTLHVGVRRQRRSLGLWSSPAPVRTVEEFAAALDVALAEVEFEGTDTYLVYEGEAFVHQAEAAPSFSASATRGYLQSKIERYAKEHGPVLSVAQPTAGPKGEKAFVLHLMLQSFYNQLRRVFLLRRLDLTRIFPMAVPVLREMHGFPIPKGAYALVAAELADATILVVAQAGGALLFSRTILASLEDSPERAAIEINRTLLYAKQQFNAAVDRIWLVTRTGRANEEVSAKCGAGKMIMVLPTQPDEWVANTARVARTHPVNLISGYIRRKRRDQFIRFGLVAIGWLCMAKFAQHLWQQHGDWRQERARIEAVQVRHDELLAERDRLLARNERVARAESLRQALEADALAPVPGGVLGYLASVLPADARLIEYSARWNEETAAWTFQCEGLIAGDDESAREAMAGLQAHLAGPPLHVRFPENQGPAVRAVVGGAQAGAGQQRFNLEGTLHGN